MRTSVYLWICHSDDRLGLIQKDYLFLWTHPMCGADVTGQEVSVCQWKCKRFISSLRITEHSEHDQQRVQHKTYTETYILATNYWRTDLPNETNAYNYTDILGQQLSPDIITIWPIPSKSCERIINEQFWINKDSSDTRKCVGRADVKDRSLLEECGSLKAVNYRIFRIQIVRISAVISSLRWLTGRTHRLQITALIH